MPGIASMAPRRLSDGKSGAASKKAAITDKAPAVISPANLKQRPHMKLFEEWWRFSSIVMLDFRSCFMFSFHLIWRGEYCSGVGHHTEGNLHEGLLTRFIFGRETAVEGGLSDRATTCPRHVNIDRAQEGGVAFYKFIEDNFPPIRGV